jgi:16S rRNA processing protein RimM
MAGGTRICLGQIGAAHGVRGEVRLHSFTAEPAAIANYGPLETEDGRTVAIEALRPAKDHFVATLSGVTDRDAAERLTNVKLYVPRERLPAPEEPNEFYHADLIGLAAVDRAGKKLGSVVALHNFGAGDLIEIKPDGGGTTELIAFNEIDVPSVDLAAGRIVVTPSPLVGEGGEAKPSRVRGATAENTEDRPLTRTAAGSRRQRSTLSHKGRGK